MSLPTRSAVIIRLPVPLTVPPVTLLPLLFSTGIGSPVIIDSSTELLPSRTAPSTGAHAQLETSDDLIERDIFLRAVVTDYSRVLGREPEKRF